MTKWFKSAGRVALALWKIRAQIERDGVILTSSHIQKTGLALAREQLYGILGMVPGGGIEPPRAEARRILSPNHPSHKSCYINDLETLSRNGLFGFALQNAGLQGLLHHDYITPCL